MLSNLLYVSATTSLLVGSSLTFNSQEVADYFYLIGTGLFFLKASITLYLEVIENRDLSIYRTIQ